jgi:putative DNA primase/helicase
LARSRPPQSQYFFAAAGRPWAGEPILNDQRTAKPILYNAIAGLTRDAAFQGAIRFDRFRGQTMLWAPVPWDSTSTIPRPWRDQDDREAAPWLQDNGVTVGELIAHAAMQTIAERNPYHLVMDDFHSIHWDGVPRLDTWLSSCVGTVPSPFIQAVGFGGREDLRAGLQG